MKHVLIYIYKEIMVAMKGTSAKDTVPSGKGASISILGAISEAGVIDISLKMPQAVSTSKKRKAIEVSFNMGKGPNWNANTALSGVLFQRDGCTG